MSWDSYIDNLIGHTNESCDKSCIIGLDGSKWTTDGHAKALRLTSDEANTIGSCLNTGDFSPFMIRGIHVDGTKFNFLRGEGNVAYGKKGGAGAISMQKSKTAVVIAHTVEGKSQENTNKGVAIIAEYLESIGQ